MCVELSNVSVTSQKDWLLRVCVPPKMTSCMFEPRIVLADCSPNTQRIGIGDVALAAAVGADDARYAVIEFDLGLIRKGFKTVEFDLFEIQSVILPCFV